jgi:hypothetical protein
MKTYMAASLAYLFCLAAAALGGAATALVLNTVLVVFGISSAAAGLGSLAALAVGAGYGAFLFLVASAFLTPFRHAGGCAALMQGLGAALVLAMLAGSFPVFVPSVKAFVPLVAAYLLAAGASLAVGYVGTSVLPRHLPLAFAASAERADEETE